MSVCSVDLSTYNAVKSTYRAILIYCVDLYYNGILPCFLGGCDSVLLAVISNAWIILNLVSLGKIISSIYPFSAAR